MNQQRAREPTFVGRERRGRKGGNQTQPDEKEEEEEEGSLQLWKPDSLLQRRAKGLEGGGGRATAQR